MRASMFVLVALSMCSGCNSLALERYTLNQSMSVADMRYHQVLDALAVVANNNGNLPSLAMMNSGIANVTNTVSVDTATLWDAAVKGFSKNTLVAFGQHNPELQWTVDPVVTQPQLEALYFACLWAVNDAEGRGPSPFAEGSRPMEVLRAPKFTDINGCNKAPDRPTFHFDVASQLQELSLYHPGWLHVAPKDCAPKAACYKATCGDTTVWVTKEGMAGLSEFTLVMLDIGTTDTASLVLGGPKASVVINKKKNPAGATGKAGSTVMGQGDKITETWNICQDIPAGPIKLKRPGYFKVPTTQMPEITLSDAATVRAARHSLSGQARIAPELLRATVMPDPTAIPDVQGPTPPQSSRASQ
jgi:hypothetical protein